jgi:tRNA nucleotidyltransferase (CCA-adding enzyme)
MLALEAASDLSPDPVVRFAALVHDLGKGTTPPELWPKHTGHEERGVALIEQLCARLRVPTEHRELAVQASRQHAKVHRMAELRPATVLELLEQVDAFRRPERLERLLLACEADARGRGPELRVAPYPQAKMLRAAHGAASAVRLPPDVLAGGDGAVIAERLRADRIAAIRKMAPSQFFES